MIATPAPEAEARRSLVQNSDESSNDQADHRHEPDPNSQSQDASAVQKTPMEIKMEDEPPDTAPSEIDENSAATTIRSEPQPSTKQGESELALLSPDNVEKIGKKRKRQTSPPWQFPTAETSTLKTADGRRISARVNVTTPGLSESDDRARSVSQPVSKSRPASPPWKKFAADGPTSIHIDGRRKSGRVNKELSETPKRTSPRSKKQVDRFATPKAGEKATGITRNRAASLRKSNVDHNGSILKPERPTSSSSKSGKDEKVNKIADLQRRIAALQPPRSLASPEERGTRAHKRKSSEVSAKSESERVSSPPSRRKTQRPTNPPSSPDASRPTQRIKLRFNASRYVVEPPHPQARMPSPARPPQLSIHQLIDKFDLREMQQPYLENDREAPDQEFFLQRAIKQAAEEGAIRQRLVKEARSGGVLSKESLSLFQNDRQPEPLEQHAHNDHLVAHALYLRQLQQREKAHHRLLAKKLAHEAVEYWRAVNGPTEEDLVAEQTKILELVRRQVVADIDARWRLVEAHVREVKRVKWEAEQDAVRAERLQEKLQWSENLLAKQRGEVDSDIDMDEDSTGDVRSSEDSDEGDEDDVSLDENMSESQSEANESESDQGEMGEEALAAYLAQREAEAGAGERSEDEEDMFDTSQQVTETGDQGTDGEQSPMDVESNNWALESNLPVPQPISHHSSEDGQVCQTSDLPEAQESEQKVRRRRGSSPISQTKEEAEAEQHLSSDESTNMDSEDYDSDEDMTTSSENDDDESNDDNEDTTSDDGAAIAKARNSLLALYSSKDLARDREGGLPTPVTSVENGGDNENARSSSEARSDDHTDSTSVPIVQVDEEDAPAAPDDKIGVDGATPKLECHKPESVSENHVDHQTTMADTSIEDATVAEATDHQTTTPEADDKTLVPSPSLLRGTLRSYQHAGLDWLASLYRNGTNGILADEMGLGKTIQTIALLAHLAEVHEVWETHLVIVPTSVILNWVTEFQKFLPGFRVLGYYGTSEERQNKRRGWVNDPHHENKEKRGYNVIITSYNVAMQDINAIRNVQWHYLILDEAHNIRNFNSQRWQVLIRLRTRARLLLTGTPLQNNLSEVWALLTFLTAGEDDRSHGELEEFLGHWKDPVKEIFDKGVQTLSTQAQKVIDQLHISLRPFLLRRKKSEVEKDLPKKTESVVVCKLSKRQRQLYQDYMGLAETRATLAKGSGIQAGAVLLSLRRVCNHPDLFDPRPIQTSFAMERSIVDNTSVKERLVRQLLGPATSVPERFRVAAREGSRREAVHRSRMLSASGLLLKQVKEIEAKPIERDPDPSTISGTRALQRLQQRERKLDSLRACITATDRSVRSKPVYGVDLRELVTVHKTKPYSFLNRRNPVLRSQYGWPALGHCPLKLEHPGDWHLIQSSRLQQDVMTLDGYAQRMRDTIVRFAFVPPSVTAPVLGHAVPSVIQNGFRSEVAYPRTLDHSHESRIRLSIAFPDARLLIYDSGKLQRLTYLLRELQSKGSRSLIFTQMTGTLNILEQFLSLLNIPYLRLDGSTPIERRQLYSAEFNRSDSKYQCMILSSRAGGVGLNLTGASSVIFYDLDWNPQMDRQCMDRAHRIGQVRDVEVYKMVSEKTVEENILRRASQKSLLDQTVIQDGHFTTDHPTRQRDDEANQDGDGDEVSAAIERFLGGGEKSTTQALESVEDKEDVDAAQQARKEDHQDDIDFAERTSKDPSKANTPAPSGADFETVDGENRGHIDRYMIRYMEQLLQDQQYVPPPVRKLDKTGRDPSHRPKRRR